MILIDLQKAFDILDHKILLDKIKGNGFPDKIKWLHSHLTNRACLVALQNMFLEAETINYGVFKDLY